MTLHTVIKFNLPLNVGTEPDIQLNVNLAKILKKYKPANLENNLAALSDVKNVHPFDLATVSWEPRCALLQINNETLTIVFSLP